jgi:hypothetical protein
MQHSRWVLALSPLVWAALADRAHADDATDEAARAAVMEVQQFAFTVSDATTTGIFGNGFSRAPADCTAAVQAGTANGMKATDTFDGANGVKVLWKRASEICATYTKLHAVNATIEVIHPQLEMIRAYYQNGTADKSVRGDAYRDTVKAARTCVDNIDKAIKAGVATDVAFAPNGNQADKLVTLAEVKTECASYIDWGTKAADADDKRQAAELAALREKWGKLGITGDRLTYLVNNDTHIILGKGCVELGNKGKKTSPVFYEAYSDDTSWIVYKTQFKKDKQIRTTSKRFRRDGGYTCK